MVSPQQALVTLPTNDQSYAAWVAAHPQGYIINAHKSHSVPMVWHRAEWGHIKPDGVLHWVTGDYLKACSLNPGALAEWAKERPETLVNCQACRDKWMSEH